jgi:cell wall assembly regulator SMI1
MTTGDAGLRDIARALAKETSSQSGEGWSTAILQLQGSGGALSWNSWTDVELYTSVDLASHADALMALPPGTVEIRVKSTGEYTFTGCPHLDEVSNGRVILDKDYRYPGHPLPGMPRPASAEPTGAPTEPTVLAEVTTLAGEFAERYTEIVGHAPDWREPCTEEELAAAEASMGVRLPEDVRALYLVADGDFEETGLLGRHSLFPLAEVVEQYLEGVPGSYGWEDDLSDDGVVFETVPFGRVKRLSRNDFWVTVGSDRGGNYVAVDLDPAEHGHAGQVIEYGRDIHGPLEHVSTSVRTILTEVVEALRAGKYEVYGDHYLRADIDDNQVRSHDEVISDAVDLAATIAGLDQPELVQMVYLNDPADVDLAVFDPLTSLRLLSLNRGQQVTPSIGGLEHLESLQITARAVDLTALAGHPTLWYVKLGDVVEPLDITPLRSLPQLVRLDVAGSRVRNIDLICDMPNLRVLKVDADQLRQIFDSGKPLPKIAALYIAGRTFLKDTVDLANSLFGRNVTVTEFADSLG